MEVQGILPSCVEDEEIVQLMIDIDSQTSKREEIITLMKERFDTPTLKKVINIGTFTIAKSKSAVQAACKGIGLDTDTIDNIKILWYLYNYKEDIKWNKY